MIKNPINLGTNQATTQDWLNTTKDLKLTAFDPSSFNREPLIEPGQAVQISTTDRARMNHAVRGGKAPVQQL
jgi:hypothetical protein